MAPTRLSIEVKQCLICGSARNTKFRFRTNHLSPEVEVCRLYHEVRDLDLLVEDVIPIQQIYLLRKANAFGPASIAKFPCEILDSIFEHARQLTSCVHPHFHVVLSSVCSRWREIIHSSPLFWTRLSLDFGSPFSKHFTNRINLFRLYLKHSGSVPLDLNLSFTNLKLRHLREMPNISTLVHPSIDNTLMENLPRIRTLYLENASPKWLAFIPRLSGLETFRYRGNVGPYLGAPVASFANSNCLCNLDLTGWSLFKPDFGAFADLSTLTLNSMEVTVCVGLLSACPKLVEYRCQAPINRKVSSWFPYRPWKTLVTRENLKIFEWEMTRDADLETVESAMFQYLRLPVIKSLLLHTNHHCRHASVRLFCKRMPTSLSVLNLSMNCGPSETEDACLFKLFPAGCAVEHLTLFSNGCLQFLPHVFSLLEDPTRLPKLERIIIDDKNKGINPLTGWEIEPTAEFASLIYKMLEPRSSSDSLRGFKLHFVWFKVKWSKEMITNLWLLTKMGKFCLTVEEERRSFSDLPNLYTGSGKLFGGR